MNAGMKDRRGFALPAALLVMTVLFAVMVPTLKVVEQQTKIAAALETVTDAEMASEGGYVDLLNQWDDAFYAFAPWQDTVVTRLTADSDTAYVKVTRTTEQLFLLESLAEPRTDAKVLSALTVRAGPASIAPRAALTAPKGVQLVNSAWIHGWDEHPLTWSSSHCPAPLESDQAGVLVADASSVVMGSGTSLYGYPPTEADSGLDETGLEQLGDVSYATLVDNADQHLKAGWTGTPSPAFSGPACNETLGANWGDPLNPASACGSYFPTIHVEGDLILQENSVGQGILLVDGNLTVSAGTIYLGVVVVKGTLTMNGGMIKGAVYASSGHVDGLSQGTFQIRYSSCAIQRANESHPLLDVRPIASRSWVQVGS